MFDMETIEITIAEYYDNPKYYACMPETVFNALEIAFLDGNEIASVPKAEFEEMVENFEKSTAYI